MSVNVWVGLRLTEFVLLFADDEHRARSGTHDPLRGAPDAEMFPARITVGREHNQIHVHFLRGFDDFMRRKAPTNLPARPFDRGMAN